MAKRYREFRRINMTAKIGSFLEEHLVDRTFKDHFEKCDPDNDECRHHESGTIHVARFVEPNLTVGKKRAYLDVPCPWLTKKEPEEFIELLDHVAERLRSFTKQHGKNSRTQGVLYGIAQEIEDYAHRNAMEILAEQAVDVD